MDLAEDADGRVAIYSVTDAEPVPAAPPAPSQAAARLGRALDSRWAPAVIGVALVLILVLGLLLLRR